MTTELSDLPAGTGDAHAADDTQADRAPEVAAGSPAQEAESAKGAADDDEGVTWLGSDLRRLRLREGWRLMRGWRGIVPLILVKVFRLHVPRTSAFGREFLWVDRADSVPAWAAALFAGEEPGLVSAGLRPLMTYSVRALPAGGNDLLARVFVEADGRALTQLMAIPAVASVAAARMGASCTSLVGDGTLVDTTSLPEGFDHPPDTRVEQVTGDALAVVRRHRERIAGLDLVACPADKVLDRLAAEHARSVAFHERRGLYVPLSPDEVAALRAKGGATSASPGPSEPAAAQHAAASPPSDRRGFGKFATVVVWLALVAIGVVVWSRLRGADDAWSPPPPSMMPVQRGRQVVEAKATDAQIAEALAPVRDRLEASKRQVALVRLVPLPIDDVRASKVGGEPYLEPGASPPRTVSGGPMVLLAQVNFAEVPPMRGYPTAGMLQFFIARDGERYLYGADLDSRTPDARMIQHSFRIRYVEHVDPAAMPGRAPPRCGRGCNTPHVPDRPRRMLFELRDEAISSGDVNFASVVGFDAYDWAESHATDWKVDWLDLYERAFPSASGHRLGGYPEFTQDDPRPVGTPLRLLLQLDSDEDMMWGDAGVGAFFIDPADLARRDFSRVLYSWDCH